MFWLYLLCCIIWYSYTWAIIGYMIAVFKNNLASVSTAVGIIKILTCAIIAFVFGWLFYLSIILKKRYYGITHTYTTSGNTATNTTTTTKIVRMS